MVQFSLQEAALAPYRVDNLTQHALVISQTPCPALEHPMIVDEVAAAEHSLSIPQSTLRTPHSEPR